MYSDYSPEPRLTSRVVVVEAEDKDVELVIEEARSDGAVTDDGEGEIFWLVFANEPKRVWDFTERTLRQHFAKVAS